MKGLGVDDLVSSFEGGTVRRSKEGLHQELELEGLHNLAIEGCLLCNL